MATGISSSFDITFDAAPLAATEVATITNPGRTFTIVGVTAYGAATAVCLVGKGTVATVVAESAALTATDTPELCEMLIANLDNFTFASTDNIQISATTAAINKVVIHCVAGGLGEALTEVITS